MSPLWRIPIFAILLFLGTMFWAKWQDPFSRKWLTLTTKDHDSFRCVAVLPKQTRQYPVVIYAHGSDDNLINDGNDLRQLAELGLVAISLEYNKSNEVTFGSQFESLLRFVAQQKWSNANAVAWVGFSRGAIYTLDFALQHPREQPQLLFQLSGGGIQEGQSNAGFSLLHCRVFLLHGAEDELFPIADTMRLSSVLGTNGVPVDIKIVPNLTHGLDTDRGVIFRCIGEYCLVHLVGKSAWQNYHSIAQWQAAAPPFWLFCFPAVAWAIGWFFWSRSHKPESAVKRKLKRHEIALCWLAVLLAAWALAVTAIHLATPHFAVSDRTLHIAQRFLVPLKERKDFEYLVAQPIWHGQKLRVLLTHVELANYNRELINWQVDEKYYQDYVLCPVITGQPAEDFNWRRSLWEEFYPRIRHENSSEDAARIVVRHLRERVTVIAAPDMPHDIPTIRLRQITDETGFEIIYVAALRSVGIPARLDSHGQAELFTGGKWQPAPQPVVMSW